MEWNETKQKLSMKVAKIIFIILSVSLALLISYVIINTYVSIKYGSNWEEEYLLEIVDILRVFLCYVLATTVFLIICLAKDRKRL